MNRSTGPTTPRRGLYAAVSIALLALVSCAGRGTGGHDDRNAGACQAVAGREPVVFGSGLPGDPAAPEPASGYRVGQKVATARTYMVVTANPLASKAGCDILRAGGHAADAAVAVQAVLGLVEPQSSGLGGGAFMLHYDARTRALVAYDGRETAPAAATEGYLRYRDDATDLAPPLPSARASGRSIGVPGVVRMLDLAHRENGRLPWGDLLQPAIRLAGDGFPISGRLAAAIEAGRAGLLADAEAAATFLDADGTPKALGSVLRVPAYAATLRALAAGGADALYTGAIAQAIVAKVAVTAHATTAAPITPGRMTLADLAGYQAKKREPVCTTYRAWWVCGMSPPSSGGLAVAQSLGILENFDLGLYPPIALDFEGGRPRVQAVHLVAEAERLAHADRDRYVADTDFVPLPGGSHQAMTDKTYLRGRADRISSAASLGTAQPGNLGGVPMGISPPQPGGGTSHFTIVDRFGNVVSMTTTVESSFGSFHMASGFILNNELTDFSAAPADAIGQPIANRVAAGKRPRSSMSPTLVFRVAADGSRGDFHMATGSPGGAAIVPYVIKTLIGVLDWNLDAQQATSLVDFGAANSPVTHVGGEHPNVDRRQPAGGLAGGNDPLVIGLRALGHTVSLNAQSSGIGTVVRTPGVAIGASGALQGGADPRREGLVLGDTGR